MTIIERSRDFVAELEDLRLEPYQDQAGLWTVGFGHRCERWQRPISRAEAESLLLDDLRVAAGAVEALPVALSEGQQIALVSFVFNIGVAAWKASTLRQKVLAGDFEGAAAEFGRWVHVRKNGAMVESNGLKARRAREKKLFQGVGMNERQEKIVEGLGALFVRKMKEPSTWRGLGALLATAGVASSGVVDLVAVGGAALMAVVEVVRSERK